jgi:hypothetical protein
VNAPQSKSSTNALQQNLDYFFTPRTASFAALATREFKDGLGGNLYLLLRLGIEARACFPLLLHQLAKNGQDEFTVLLDLFVARVLSVSRNTPAVLLLVSVAVANAT